MIKKISIFLLVLFVASTSFANEYFDFSTGRLSAGSIARSADVNSIFDSIETGLDKIPTEADLKRGLINYATDSGAADAYVVSLTYTPTSYTDGMEVVFKASAANTGASTINVDSLGVKSIRRQDGTVLSAGDISANKITTIRYNSTSGYFEMQGSNTATGGSGTMSTQNASSVDITGGSIAGITIDADTFSIDSTEVTATASEINTVADGITATAAEINTVADGITATASEINTTIDGATVTAAEINQLDDVAVGGNTSGDIVTTDDAQTLSNKYTSDDFGIGVSPSYRLHVFEDAEATTAQVHRQTSYTTGSRTVSDILLESEGDMADTFGPRISFSIDDTADSKQTIGAIGAERDTADNEGALIFRAGTDGDEEFMRIDHSGNVDIGTSTTKRIVPSGTFVNNSNGNPNILDTHFSLLTMTESTWESVGPTGSGADNIWTALDSVPTDADWIEIRLYVQSYHSTGATVSSWVFARAYGSSEAVNTDNTIFMLTGQNSGGTSRAHSVVSSKVPIGSSNRFDLQWHSEFDSPNSMYAFLVGWGFNP